MRKHAFHQLLAYRKSISTKPFNARGSKISRCPYCQVALHDCVCQYQPDIKTNIACLLIVSDNEVFKPSNTGRLIADTIVDTHVYQWARTNPDPQMLALLDNPSYQPILIFPDNYVDDKTRLVSDLKSFTSTNSELNIKPLFIFIDGSWREARKIFRRSEFLQSLPVLSIKPESISEYIIRHSANEQHLSTAEVASLVFEQAGEQVAAKSLQLWFEVFRESYLHSKSRNPIDSTRPALTQWIAYLSDQT